MWGCKNSIDMTLSTYLAKHLREVCFGGNWTAVNYKEVLEGVTWQQATQQVEGSNTIATLVFHTGYYVSGITRVLRGQPLDTKDAHSFDHPPIGSQGDWEAFLAETWANVRELSELMEQLPEERWWEDFVEAKYGSYYRNLQGLIEHHHYHLGQIVLLKRLIG